MADVAARSLEARAIALMREALDLFVSGGGSDAAAALQQAIDIAEKQSPMTGQDVLDSDLVDRILGPLDLAPRGHHLGARLAPDRILEDAGGAGHVDGARH